MFVWAVCGAASTQSQLKAATASPQLVQAFVGFNQPNDLGLPCASPCLLSPAGSVIIQPNQFILPGSQGLYYAVFQENGWSGNISVNFQLAAAGNNMQSIAVDGVITNGQGVTVLATGAEIPQTNYVGTATLTATATATPSNGGAPIILTSYSTLEIGGAGSRRLVQAFAGIGVVVCGPPNCSPTMPANAVVVQPNMFPDYTAAPIYYAVFQADNWQGQVQGTCDLLKHGKVIFSTSIGGPIIGQGGHPVTVLSSGGTSLNSADVGPAGLSVTTIATQRTGNQFTLVSYAELEIQ
jgi:hypothetical protein